MAIFETNHGELRFAGNVDIMHLLFSKETDDVLVDERERTMSHLYGIRHTFQ